MASQGFVPGQSISRKKLMANWKYWVEELVEPNWFLSLVRGYFTKLQASLR